MHGDTGGSSTGGNNVAVGADALTANTTASDNTALGTSTLKANTTGGNNVAVGNQALEACTTGYANVAVGSLALDALNTTFGCVAIGYVALSSVTTGQDNTAVGRNAGQNITTGQENICLGYNAGNTGSPSGNITTGSRNVVLGDNNISNLYCADTSISSSDGRDKTDVTDFTHGLSWIKELRPVTYRWDRRTWYSDDKSVTPDGSKKRDRIHIGFIAQEAIEVEKKHGYADKKDNMLIVNQDEDEADPSYGMKYERLVPVLVNAIKELSAEVEQLKSQLNN